MNKKQKKKKKKNNHAEKLSMFYYCYDSLGRPQLQGKAVLELINVSDPKHITVLLYIQIFDQAPSKRQNYFQNLYFKNCTVIIQLQADSKFTQSNFFNNFKNTEYSLSWCKFTILPMLGVWTMK